MHVVFWSPGWPLTSYQNGIITYVHAMKGEFEARGHKVSIVAGKVDPTEKDPGVHQIRSGLWRRARRRFRGLFTSGENEAVDYAFDSSAAIAAQILRIHRRDPIDVIEMEESFGWFADVARRTGIPVAVKLHGPAFLTQMGEERESRFGRERVAREGVALRGSQTIISPSAVTLRRTIERYELSPVKTRVIVNPFSVESNLPRWRLESCDPQTILFVGRFDLCKGADIVLSAFQLLLKERPNLRLCFVGPDRGWLAEDGSQVHFESYMRRMFPEKLRSSVDFRGALPHGEVARLRAGSMITVLASRWENQSYALLEAMSQGCPIVCTDAGGCPESVIDGVNGRLARSESAVDFAAKMGAMLDDPESARAMGEAAHRHVMERHALRDVATQTLEAYQELISVQPDGLSLASPNVRG